MWLIHQMVLLSQKIRFEISSWLGGGDLGPFPLLCSGRNLYRSCTFSSQSLQVHVCIGACLALFPWGHPSLPILKNLLFHIDPHRGEDFDEDIKGLSASKSLSLHIAQLSLLSAAHTFRNRSSAEVPFSGKHDSIFSTRHQLPIAPQLRMDTRESLPHPCWNIDLVSLV